MKIAHVTDCYLPRLGGIELQVHDLAARQRAAGHHVDVVSSVAPEGSGRIRYDRSWRQRRRVSRGHYDVVHVHASNFSPLAFLTAAETSRLAIPTVFTVHSLWSYAAPLFRAAAPIVGWRDWDVAWSAVSRAAAQPLQRLLGSRGEVVVLPNGVASDFWRVPPAARGCDDVRLVAVMRLARRKRPLPLLRLLAAARRLAPDVRISLDLVGDGPQRRPAERLARRLGLTDAVRFTGRLDRGEIRRLYARADGFLAPATLESFGIAALEARCAGVPVLAHARTGVADFVAHGREGLLASSDADLLHQLVEFVSRPQLRRHLAEQARSTEPAINWTAVLDGCDQLYDRAAAVTASTVAAPLTRVPAALR